MMLCQEKGEAYPGKPFMLSESKSQNSNALRYNEGKPKWSLVDFEALEPMVEVLDYGATKYDRDNWTKGFPPNRLMESLLRHCFAYLNGEDIDKESGKSHIGHIQANAMFLAYNAKHHPELDDRRGKINGHNNGK